MHQTVLCTELRSLEDFHKEYLQSYSFLLAVHEIVLVNIDDTLLCEALCKHAEQGLHKGKKRTQPDWHWSMSVSMMFVLSKKQSVLVSLIIMSHRMAHIRLVHRTRLIFDILPPIRCSPH